MFLMKSEENQMTQNILKMLILSLKILEGTVDRHYDKLEIFSKKKQPKAEW